MKSLYFMYFETFLIYMLKYLNFVHNYTLLIRRFSKIYILSLFSTLYIQIFEKDAFSLFLIEICKMLYFLLLFLLLLFPVTWKYIIFHSPYVKNVTYCFVYLKICKNVIFSLDLVFCLEKWKKTHFANI